MFFWLTAVAGGALFAAAGAAAGVGTHHATSGVAQHTTVHRHGGGRVSFHGLERLLRQQLRGIKCLLVGARPLSFG